MTEHEAKDAQQRLEKYTALSTLAAKVEDALAAVVHASSKAGPDGCTSPFTGNWRESRNIYSLHINFTKTQGGAAPCELVISEMQISAFELGSFLEGALRGKLAEIYKARSEL